MNLSRLRALFSRHVTPEPPQRNAGLDDVCTHVLHLLEQGGFSIASGLDYEDYEAGHETSSKTLGDHFRQSKTNKDYAEALQGVRDDYNGYVALHEKVIMLPDENGLRTRMAQEFGFDEAALEKAGITDQHIHADIVLHESVHAWRNTPSEFEANARGFAGFLTHGNFKPDDEVPSFIRALTTYNAIHTPLQRGKNSHTHGWSDAAMRWVSSFAAGLADLEAQDKPFTEDRIRHMQAFMDQDGRATERSFALAHQELKLAIRYPGSRGPLREAMMALRMRETAQQSWEAGEAANILLFYGEALKNLQPYCKPDSPIRQAYMRYFDTDNAAALKQRI